MLKIYQHLFVLVVYQPARIPWLAHHAWRYHKVPLAIFVFFTAAIIWALTQLFWAGRTDATDS